MGRTFRGAVIGCGYIAQRSHLPAWKREPRAQIVAVCDLQRSRAERVAGQFGVPAAYDDAGLMFQQQQLDFVDIATRPDSHLELVQMAAERKVAILCQKPLAESLSAASQMVDLAEQNGVPLMVTENWRWLPLYRSVRHYIDEGRVGRPYAARIIGSSAMPRNRPVLRTQPYFADMPRLAIFEMGIHWIDCLRAMFGDVRRVYAQTRRVNPALAGEDVAKLMLSFDDAAVGLIDMSWACHDLTVPGEHLRVEGEQGALAGQLDGQVVMLNHFEARQAQQLPVLAQADSFDLLHAHFLDKLAAGQRDFVTSGRDNLNSLAAVFAAYESAETGQAIRLRAT